MNRLDSDDDNEVNTVDNESSPRSLTVDELEKSFIMESDISDTESNVSFDIPIVGENESYSWEPPTKAFAWFKRVADKELSKELITEMLEDFIPSPEVEKHFMPPKLPSTVWKQLSANRGEYYKLNSMFQTQKLVCSAMMPLLSVLGSLKATDPNQKLLASSIQLLCTSNLQISRFRRASMAKLVKQDLKQPLFSQPVTHLELFGNDLDSSADTILKTQSSLQKMLIPKKSYRNFNNQSTSNNNASTSSAVSKQTTKTSSRERPAEQDSRSSSQRQEKAGQSFHDKNRYRGRQGRRGGRYNSQ